MHIPDGLLDPTTCAGTAVVSAGLFGYALHRVRKDLAERTVPLMGVMAACVFSAQMLNFPVPGGTSGHVLGGVLAAVMLGPWAAMLVMAMVLAVQCLLFQDGGVTALGANVLNVAVVGPLAGYAVYDLVRRWIGGLRGILVAAVLASWLTVMGAAVLCALELALGGYFRLGPTMGAMLLVHSLIGVGEALVTGMALAFVLQVRPDLVYGRPAARPMLVRSGQVVTAGMLIALVMGAILSPLASPLPDGLEASVSKLGFDLEATEPAISAPFADYNVTALESLGIAGSAAGALGAVVVFAIALTFARRWPRSPAQSHL